MPLTLTWQDIAIRLALSVVAGGLIGLDRGEHGRPAGLRTTLLVCLSAAIAMIQTNLLLDTTGKTGDSFVTLDLMRLPLGILTGMGFIGGGAILRRDGFVLGVTTAATLSRCGLSPSSAFVSEAGRLSSASHRLHWAWRCSKVSAGSTTG
jgi:putative Mg2+ transporter-C (MgtC) family protein